MKSLVVHSGLVDSRCVERQHKLLNNTVLCGYYSWHTATTARPFWPPARRKVAPFQNIPLFFISTMPYHQPINFTCPVRPLLTHVQRLYTCTVISKYHAKVTQFLFVVTKQYTYSLHTVSTETLDIIHRVQPSLGNRWVNHHTPTLMHGHRHGHMKSLAKVTVPLLRI